MNIKDSKNLKVKDIMVLLKRLRRLLQVQSMIKECNQLIQ